MNTKALEQLRASEQGSILREGSWEEDMVRYETNIRLASGTLSRKAAD